MLVVFDSFSKLSHLSHVYLIGIYKLSPTLLKWLKRALKSFLNNVLKCFFVLNFNKPHLAVFNIGKVTVNPFFFTCGG